MFGNTADYEAAIELALRIAKGFFPVRVELPPPVPTMLLVPEDLSLSFIIRLDIGLLAPAAPPAAAARPPAPPAPSDPPLLVEELVLELEVLL